VFTGCENEKDIVVEVEITISGEENAFGSLSVDLNPKVNAVIPPPSRRAQSSNFSERRSSLETSSEICKCMPRNLPAPSLYLFPGSIQPRRSRRGDARCSWYFFCPCFPAV
jgi:hypothetical protein